MFPMKAGARRDALRVLPFLIGVLVCVFSSQSTGQESRAPAKKNLQFSAPSTQTEHGGTVRLTPTTLSEWLVYQEDQYLDLLEEQGGVTPAEPRGGGQKIYNKVAPCVVAVRTWAGHGTGFLIDREGLILTNYHVIHTGTFVDAEVPASYAWVHMGRMQESGRMERVSEVPALVLAVDPARDLALLKLQRVPEGLNRLPRVELARHGPKPGQECSIVGHPSSGMLWTYRDGLVSALGQSPHDIVNFLLPRLGAEGAEREQVEAMFDSLQTFDIVLSSCLANPGDSGGPLVDRRGRLIGVTFAIPGNPSEQKFTYHIALSEIRAFLDEAAQTPILLIPDAWQIGPMLRIVQRNVLIGGGPGWQQILFDVDTDTPLELLEQRDFNGLVGARGFDAEVALHGYRNRRLAFYDTDNNGEMNVVLVDHDEDDAADFRYRLEAQGRWHLDADINSKWLDPDLCGPLAQPLRDLLIQLEITE
ncbi:MAG: trypsin-like peptidase domain-containing protein [Candidatus Latescibacterota bacterium]|nr:MAG: trypsin-like peptidase domain-containing protein [Candidatus Latescibacterota bacterium]